MANEALVDISAKSIDKLPVSPEVKAALKDIQADVADAYRQGFVEMVQAIKKQESVLDRIHATLAILVKHFAPQLEGQIPAAFRVAADGEAPDLASTVVVADPIGRGYSLSQSEVATALGISSTDVSSLIRAFKLSEDGSCAVVVRQGKKHKFVNYHVRALDRFRELVRTPPAGINPSLKNVLARARKAIAVPK